MTIIATTTISIATHLTETTPEKSITTTTTAIPILGSRDFPSSSSIREIIMHGFSLHTSN